MYASREKGRVGVPTERRLVMMVPVVMSTERHAFTVEGLDEMGFLYWYIMQDTHTRRCKAVQTAGPIRREMVACSHVVVKNQ